LIGLFVGILRLARWPVIDWLLIAYIELFRCTPLLVQIIWFYYVFSVVIGVNIPAHVAAVTWCRFMVGHFMPRSRAVRASNSMRGTAFMRLSESARLARAGRMDVSKQPRKRPECAISRAGRDKAV